MAFNAAAALEAEVFAATYVVEIHGVSYTLPVRYQEPVLIGGGTFGQVIGAVDTMTGESVAVKKLTRWNHSVDDCKRAFREIKLLRLLNIEGLCADLLRIIHVYSPQHTIEEFQDIFFVCERAPSNLHEILHTNPLSIDHVRLMMYQLLRGLHYLASANILHRDLKPSNIAVFEGVIEEHRLHFLKIKFLAVCVLWGFHFFFVLFFGCSEQIAAFGSWTLGWRDH
eukprot:m.463213 g.463213  ORF g.463213 m.463213 type:complete len:225 (-) comp57030_c0_seq12:628-1302(-)